MSEQRIWSLLQWLGKWAYEDTGRGEFKALGIILKMEFMTIYKIRMWRDENDMINLEFWDAET